EKPFREVYPRLFALERDKEIHVAVKLASLIDSFRRPVRGGVELQQLTDLVSLMDSVVLCSSHDRWRCDLSSDGDFSVKVIRNYIDDKFMPSHSEPSRWVQMRRIFIMCCFDVRLLRLLCAEFVVGGLLTRSHGLLFRTGMRGSLT
nr:RNA-directed DNA polymerase, eukaryota [Tanacetum cinerariifolium]